MADSLRDSLEGRRALVTGGTRGLGVATARELSRRGAAVAITGRDEQHAQHIAGDIAAETGRRVVGLTWNVEDTSCGAADANSLIDTVIAELGALDIVVNNAGVIHRAPATRVTVAEWEHVLSVNLTAPFLLSQAAAGRMTGAASIVNMSSVLASSAGREVVGYATSKAALVQMTRALAVEWASLGIRVNALAAGYSLTDLTRTLHDNADRYLQTLTRIPLSRWAEAAEIAAPVAFLCSDAASYITGTTLHVDGGWTAT